MDAVAVIASSTLVAAVVGAGAGYFSQRALATRQARLSYEYAARGRLYEAIGPLRFQLVLACRDVARRITSHVEQPKWELNPAQYYGSSTMYRLLRPLAICTLLQRQMNAVDFSVDPGTFRLLQFESAAYRMLTDAAPLPGYPHLDWSSETQHVYSDNLRRAAVRLIKDGTVLDYAEFLAACPDPIADDAIAPLARILKAAGGSLRNNPVFWVRLVGYAYLCQHFVNTHGPALGFTARTLDVPALLSGAGDAHADNQEAIYQRIVDEAL